MKERVKIKGRIVIYNKTKNKVEYDGSNTLTNLAKEFFADRISSDGVGYVDYLAIGDGSGSHDKSSTALFSEMYRKQITTKSTPGSSAVFTTTILGDEAVGNWTELGLFNASSGGTLIAVSNVSYTHVSGDEVEVRWEISFE